jgi:hypothetical protein
MTYRIRPNPATPAAPTSFSLANEAGQLARTTAGRVYQTRKPEAAFEAVNYLNGSKVNGVRSGSQRMQSMFGRH